MRFSFRMAALCMAVSMFSPAQARRQSATGVTEVQLSGYVGERIDQCIEKRIMGQNADELVAPFRQQNETKGRWASEFWGKWVQGAMASYEYNRDAALFAKIRDAEQQLMGCQLKNGFLGDYVPENETTGWDIWGRKYTLLGLVKWYRLSGDKKALKAACRLLDYTLTQVGPAPKKAIYECGFYKGMPPMSILEPVMFLYNETKNPAYLDFAKYIVSAGEEPDGPQLIARANVPVDARHPIPKGGEWYGRINGQKAYEMMSCYVGMLELYKVTREERLLRAAETTWQDIAQRELNIAGGAASHECWYGGRLRQAMPAARTMETCVTFTWLQFCERLLELTGDAKYVDAMERTIYNALMASMKWDGSQIVKYVPIEGYRREGENQCDVRINCCNANGPRAFALIPRVAYRTPSANRLDVNLYIPSETTVRLSSGTLALRQSTRFPQDGEVTLVLSPERPMKAQIALRIPSWSERTVVRVNGKDVDGVRSGSYCVLDREWKEGDEIDLTFDLTARIERIEGNEAVAAITRGPIVLARDSRFVDGAVDEPLFLSDKDGIVELEPIEAPAPMWMAFKLTCLSGYYQDWTADRREIHLCDFASAGNTWDEHERYRTWLPMLYVPH